MNSIERKVRRILIAQFLKSAVLIALGCVAIVGLSLYLYGLWQTVTGLGWPLFLVAEAATLVVAYFLGMLPAIDRLIATLRDDPVVLVSGAMAFRAHAFKQRKPATVGLLEVTTGNPFADHPQLRAIWPAPYAKRAEADTVCRLKEPNGSRIFLILGNAGRVVGITGYFIFDDHKGPLAAEPGVALGLRWHGVVPGLQRHWYSRWALEILSRLGKVAHPECEMLIELMPMESAARLDKPFRRHGFVPVGAPAEYDWLVPGQWQAYQRPLPPLAQALKYESWRRSPTMQHDRLPSDAIHYLRGA